MTFSLPLIARIPPRTRPWVGAAAAGLGLGGLGYAGRPYVRAWSNSIETLRAQDSVSPELKAQLTAQRRRSFEEIILNQYVRQGTGKIDWYQFADIVEFIARSTPSDEAFREDLWALFGWQAKGVRSPLATYLDPSNHGLPAELHNTGTPSEQMHHYLGGTTGNTDRIPSHLKNNRLYAYYYELKDAIRRGSFNWGDVRLFNVAQEHRNDFLKQGRFVVAGNIRTMLNPKPLPGLSHLMQQSLMPISTPVQPQWPG